MRLSRSTLLLYCHRPVQDILLSLLLLFRRVSKMYERTMQIHSSPRRIGVLLLPLGLRLIRIVYI